MNAQIRELAEQAQQYAEHTTPQGLEWFDTFKLKFAEFIVKECAEHIRNRAMRAGGACTIVGEESLWLAKDLEKHFEVEE